MNIVFYNDADKSIIHVLPVRYHNTYSVSYNIIRCLNFLFYIINQKYRPYSQLTLRPSLEKTDNLKSVTDKLELLSSSSSTQVFNR